MREFDTIGLRLCIEQAEIFELSAEYISSSSEIFIKNYMHSKYISTFDNKTIINYPVTSQSALDEYLEEYPTIRGNKKYPKDVLYWIGYIYRYWSYVYDKTSLSIYKIIKPHELKQLYYPYHTLDQKNEISY